MSGLKQKQRDQEESNGEEDASLTGNQDDTRVAGRDTHPTTGLIYGVEDVPPPILAFFIALQQVAMSISGSIAVPLIVTELVCLQRGSADAAYLVSTFLFMCGVSTLLQCSIGVRLPIIQGGCAKFIPAIAALVSIDRLRCSAPSDPTLTDVSNMTNSSLETAPSDITHLVRIREPSEELTTTGIASDMEYLQIKEEMTKLSSSNCIHQKQEDNG